MPSGRQTGAPNSTPHLSREATIRSQLNHPSCSPDLRQEFAVHFKLQQLTRSAKHKLAGHATHSHRVDFQTVPSATVPHALSNSPPRSWRRRHARRALGVRAALTARFLRCIAALTSDGAMSDFLAHRSRPQLPPNKPNQHFPQSVRGNTKAVIQPRYPPPTLSSQCSAALPSPQHPGTHLSAAPHPPRLPALPPFTGSREQGGDHSPESPSVLSPEHLPRSAFSDL